LGGVCGKILRVVDVIFFAQLFDFVKDNDLRSVVGVGCLGTDSPIVFAEEIYNEIVIGVAHGVAHYVAQDMRITFVEL
tara:strand:+ start:309 stop:542 length:234 start_codon:yes stop_codon:yes gene_type:complete